jgi:hypothetical protein
MKRLSKLLPLAVNIVLPLLIYHYAAPHFGERNALILSSIPPILWSVMELARFRRLDAVSLLAVIGILLSLAAMALGGNPRLLLARESLVTGIIGLSVSRIAPATAPTDFLLGPLDNGKRNSGSCGQIRILLAKTALHAEHVHHDVGLGPRIGFRSCPAILAGLCLAG